MKVIVPAAVLLLAGAAHGQTPPAQTPAPQATPIPPASTLTRDLNSGPPAPAIYLAPAPAPATAPMAVAEPGSTPVTSAAPPVATPRATPAPPPAAIITPTPRPAPNSAPAPTTAPPRSVAPTPVLPPSTPFTPPGASPASAPTVPLEAVVPPPASSLTVLDSAARAALPFTADLPPGFEIVSGRPGPDFRIYTIRRGAQSFVMVYAGPASQFPIYSGQMVEAGGRASILSTEDGVRHAVEHLFQRPTSPSEIHVWTMSLDGADRDMAEQIALSVDVR